LRLQLPAPSFTVPPLDRALLDSQTVRGIVHYADENGNRSDVTVRIDTAAPVPWSISISNLSLAMESGSFGELHRVVGTLSAAANAPTSLTNARLVFGPPLKPVQDVVAFLEAFGAVPPVDVALTNEWSLQVGEKFDFAEMLKLSLPELQAFLEKFIDDLDVVVSLKFGGENLLSVMEFEVALKFPLPLLPIIIVVGLAKVQLVLGNPNVEVF
jgi:hypothetical protein